MIIDALVRMGPSFDGREKSIEDYIAGMKREGIDRAILCPNKPASYDVTEGNSFVAEILKTYPDLFFGAVRIDPWRFAEQRSRYDACFENRAFRFVYLSPWEETFRCNDEPAFPAYEYAIGKGVPVIIETGQPYVAHITQIADVSERFPELNIITTNGGGIDLSGILAKEVDMILQTHENIYDGTCASVDGEKIAAHMDRICKGRVVFQSNYPVYDLHTELYRVQNSYASEEGRMETLGAAIQQFLK